jgi:hypothetical protein
VKMFCIQFSQSCIYQKLYSVTVISRALFSFQRVPVIN